LEPVSELRGVGGAEVDRAPKRVPVAQNMDGVGGL
jgi:hypothetical protein